MRHALAGKLEFVFGGSIPAGQQRHQHHLGVWAILLNRLYTGNYAFGHALSSVGRRLQVLQHTWAMWASKI